MLLFLLLIKPPEGDFRTKISSIESEIKAYTLLERNKNRQNAEEFIVKTHSIKFKEPACEKFKEVKREKTSLINALKINTKSAKKIYWNNGNLEL